MSTVIAPKKPEIRTSLPGPKAQVIIDADAKFVNPSYPRPSSKLVVDHASGVWVHDVDGNLFLDCNAGVAVCSTGHCHPEVVAAIELAVNDLDPMVRARLEGLCQDVGHARAVRLTTAEGLRSPVALAAQPTDPAVQRRLLETAQGWMRLAFDFAKMASKSAEPKDKLVA